MRKVAVVLFRSFLKGLIILGPLAITVYLLWMIFSSVDDLIPTDKLPRGVGFIIIVVFVTGIGYLGTRSFIGKAIFDFFDHLIQRTPVVKFIYSSVKDVMDSFVGDKKKFTQPVWVRTSSAPEIWRIGFLTQPDAGYLGAEGKAAVYLPHSYAISGWVIMVDQAQIMPVTTMTPAEAMKFAVSGGITTVTEGK